MTRIAIETERLILREWGEEDEWAFYDVMNTPAVMRWLGGVHAPEEWHTGY
jgi:RimJ/RimL family protein N-acetyltransferase